MIKIELPKYIFLENKIWKKKKNLVINNNNQ